MFSKIIGYGMGVAGGIALGATIVAFYLPQLTQASWAGWLTVGAAGAIGLGFALTNR